MGPDPLEGCSFRASTYCLGCVQPSISASLSFMALQGSVQTGPSSKALAWEHYFKDFKACLFYYAVDNNNEERVLIGCLNPVCYTRISRVYQIDQCDSTAFRALPATEEHF